MNTTITQSFTQTLPLSIVLMSDPSGKVSKPEEKETAADPEDEKSETEETENEESLLLDLDLSEEEPEDSPGEIPQGLSISDALLRCLNDKGKVDLSYIGILSGQDRETIIESLSDSIFYDPVRKEWQTADEYLSGNLWKKSMEAQKVAEDAPEFSYMKNNLRAIAGIMPAMEPERDIYITLGSPWVPTEIIDEFIFDTFGDPYANLWYSWQADTKEQLIKKGKVRHSQTTGSWYVPLKSRYRTHSQIVATERTFGTPRINALHILECSLNMQDAVVQDATWNDRGKKNYVINEEETLRALEKQQKLTREFQEWVWKDEQRAHLLRGLYETLFCCTHVKHYDGSFLTLPGLSPSVHLFPFQKNAVARILFSPNVLLAHDVGAGKTFEMIVAAHELKRTQNSKNLIVVPNSLTGQWKEFYHALYPQAQVLVVDPASFTKKKRQNVLAQIRYGDYDSIIMAYSCFDEIPFSCQHQCRVLTQKMKELEKEYRKGIPEVKKKIRKNHEKLEELQYSATKEDTDLYFDGLGITNLFVDEAHNYKNVPLESHLSNVSGISLNSSAKCRGMLEKVRLIQQNRGHVVFATATPITNSLCDIFAMQYYLQDGTLNLLNLNSFDNWVGMFAEKHTEFEVDVDTTKYRMVTRFSKFHNLPELTALIGMIADFYFEGSREGLPETDGYQDVLLPKTERFEDYLKAISQRADIIRNGCISAKEDNMLKVTTDGRKAALDLRLVSVGDNSDGTKVRECARKVAEIFAATEEQKSTQLVFCDISTPKAGFNIYDELKKELISLDVPEDQIAFIHDADTETKKERLMADMRRGTVRILVGSTSKLGIGTNVQNKLIAIHHLDVPWRPADMTQREGRILRRGNENRHVQIFRYITEGSFDAYSWQLLETKQRFISSLLAGCVSTRSQSDISDTVLQYAEVKALAVGDPLIRKRVETENELSRYYLKQANSIENKTSLSQELSHLDNQLANLQSQIEKLCQDIETIRTAESAISPEKEDDKRKRSAERKEIRSRLEAALLGNNRYPSERVLMNYRGFDVILPSYMSMCSPYVWLKRAGKYYVEMGDSDAGNLVRLDHFIDSLDRLRESYENNRKDWLVKKEKLKEEMGRCEDYEREISECTKRLKAIDAQLEKNRKSKNQGA